MERRFCMPNIQSARKRLHQAEKRRAVNFSVKARIKTIQKKVWETALKKQGDETEKHFRIYSSTVDKAVAAGIFKKNTGARKKSRLARRVHTAIHTQ